MNNECHVTRKDSDAIFVKYGGNKSGYLSFDEINKALKYNGAPNVDDTKKDKQWLQATFKKNEYSKGKGLEAYEFNHFANQVVRHFALCWELKNQL